jgi:hypothetical protein
VAVVFDLLFFVGSLAVFVDIFLWMMAILYVHDGGDLSLNDGDGGG